MTHRSALVTGATGALGPALVEALLNDGYQVRALVRQSADRSSIPNTVQVVPGDLGDRAALEHAVKGIDTVFHLAARLHTDTSNADAAMRSEYERVNVTGTRELAQAAAAAGVQRFVFFSTIAVYGASNGRAAFDETSPVVRDTLYTATKLDAETAAREAPGSVVLRIAATYGPRMKANYRRLARAIERGVFVPVGDGSNRRTLIYEADVAKAALLAAAQAPTGSTYNVTDGGVHTLREILDAIAAAVDRKLPPVHLPIAPTRALAGMIGDGLKLIGRKSSIGRGTVDKFVEDVAVSGERFQADLGFRPSTDFMAGWRRAVS